MNFPVPAASNRKERGETSIRPPNAAEFPKGVDTSMDKKQLTSQVCRRLCDDGVRSGTPRQVAQRLIATFVEEGHDMQAISLDDVKAALVDALRASHADPCDKADRTAA